MGEARVTRKRIKELYYIIKKIYLVEYVRCVLTLAWNALPNAPCCRKVSGWNDYNVLWHSPDSSISIYTSSHLLHLLLMRHLDLKCAVRHNRNSPFTVYRPFETMQRCSSVGQKKRTTTPCYPACSVRGFEGGRQVSWRVGIMWLVMWYIAGGREEALTPYKERKWCTFPHIFKKKKIDTPCG